MGRAGYTRHTALITARTASAGTALVRLAPLTSRRADARPFARPPLDLLLGWSRLVKRCDLAPVGPSICRLQLRYCPCCVT